MGVEQIILVNLGLGAISVFGLLIAIFIGIGLVSKEIERRTIYNILSKPVTRAEFILGKYAGLLLTLFVNTAIMTAGFYVALAIQKRGLALEDLSLLVAVYFILLELAIVVGIAIFFSCISTSILSAVFTFCLFVIGNFSSDIRWFGQESGSPVLEKATAILYYILPNFSDFNVIDQAAHGVRIPSVTIIANTCYALLYITILLSAAVLIFEERGKGAWHEMRYLAWRAANSRFRIHTMARTVEPDRRLHLPGAGSSGTGLRPHDQFFIVVRSEGCACGLYHTLK